MASWRGKFANCTYVIVSLLNLECDCCMDRVQTMPSFNALSITSTPEIVLSRKNLNSSSKVANWIIVDILKYFN